ncbi:uncharacterized protein [Littorina saxatilis]|uniref:uncharacterized protein n=1 Tax=Littorina saxatilis TaxID=31220 RepID=UPI0038B6180B
MSTRLQVRPATLNTRGQVHSLQTLPSSASKLKYVRFFSIKPIIDDRASVREHLRRTSVVYAKKSAPSARSKLGQKQVTQLRLNDWDRYNWTLPSLANGGQLHHTCTRPRLGPREVPLSLRDRDQLLREGGDGAEVRPSLPPLGRSSLGQPMLRRPTTQQSGRTDTVGDELLDMLGNYLDLKPISDLGQGQRGTGGLLGGSSTFYRTHFPLLLQKKKFNDDDDEQGDSKVVSHRQMMSRPTSAQRRRVDLNRRCGTLERALTSLERGADDMEEGDHVGEGVFITELRQDTFDPRSWPWNAKRYQS